MKVFFFLLSLCMGVGAFASEEIKVLPPLSGAYQGAYADFGPVENQVTEEAIRSYTKLTGKKLAWAYFSDHWLDGDIHFPAGNVETCRKMGVIPYIRMSPWSEMTQSQQDPVVTMQKIIDGEFDEGLRTWARSARDSGTAIMIEFGPEVNGDWFPWNGRWNGGSSRDRYGDPTWPDGPERFRDAYRQVIQIFREEKALNITWILHVDVAWTPQASWNHMKFYYPGDDYIDWIGLSVFGRQLPKNNWILFPSMLKSFLKQIEETSEKPVLISEFGVIEDAHDPKKKAAWLKQALQSISKGLFKNVKGITYWNSPGWLADGSASFKIDSSPQALEAFRTEISQPFWLENVRLGPPETP
ncbi:MAG: hypothetical protein KF789_02895 [Bdellovibrionaceae bacterium]|nr:hypothetical protein [Pseudobdellovibrionaceae bacterium]